LPVIIEAIHLAPTHGTPQQSVAAADIGRNIVTRGVSLNQLVGRTSTLNQVVQEDMETAPGDALTAQAPGD
jgi:MOSC domain-containing protein YiiM